MRKNKATMATGLAALLLTLAVSGTAQATSYGEFCAAWGAQFSLDGDQGNYPTPLTTGATSFTAKYSYYLISKNDGEVEWKGWLDSSGCTTIPITEMTTYDFTVYTMARVTGPVTVQVQNGAATNWSGSPASATTTFTTGYLINGTTRQFQFDIPFKLLTISYNERRVMPAFQQALQKVKNGEIPLPANTFTRVSFNSTLCGGLWCGDDGNICLTEGSTVGKNTILHEYGHAVSIALGGPIVYSYAGDDGVYAAEHNDTDLRDGICDSTVTRSDSDPGATHNFETREFIGAAMGEGFAHFISTAITNRRFDADGQGEFGYYFRVMKDTDNVDNPISGSFNCTAPPEDYCYHPVIPLTDYTDTAPGVRWVTNACPDATAEGFQHFGTEWDWLNFYWALWTGGTTTTRYTIAQIADIWGGVPDTNAARLCCFQVPIHFPPYPNPPSGCEKTHWLSSSNCPTSKPVIFNVGKLWTTDADYSNTPQVLQTAYNLYGSSKGDRLADVGGFTGVVR